MPQKQGLSRQKKNEPGKKRAVILSVSEGSPGLTLPLPGGDSSLRSE
jgi:hypothetical protein